MNWSWLFGKPKNKADDEAAAPPKGDIDFLCEKGVASWNSLRGPQAAQFVGVNFNAKAPGSKIWGKPLDLVGPNRVVLRGIKLTDADLSGCVMAEEDVPAPAPAPKGKKGSAEPAKKHDERWPGADLRGAILVRANFSGAKLKGVNFEGADLTEADLGKADLRGANFARANLQNAHLGDAELQGANFAWADLTGAVFTQGGLKGLNLFGAKLAHASVDGLNPRWLVFGRHVLGGRVWLHAPKTR